MFKDWNWGWRRTGTEFQFLKTGAHTPNGHLCLWVGGENTTRYESVCPQGPAPSLTLGKKPGEVSKKRKKENKTREKKNQMDKRELPFKPCREPRKQQARDYCPLFIHQKLSPREGKWLKAARCVVDSGFKARRPASKIKMKEKRAHLKPDFTVCLTLYKQLSKISIWQKLSLEGVQKTAWATIKNIRGILTIIHPPFDTWDCNYENGLYLQAPNLGIPSALRQCWFYFYYYYLFIFASVPATVTAGNSSVTELLTQRLLTVCFAFLLTVSDHAIPPVKSFQWSSLIAEAAPDHHLGHYQTSDTPVPHLRRWCSSLEGEAFAPLYEGIRFLLKAESRGSHWLPCLKQPASQGNLHGVLLVSVLLDTAQEGQWGLGHGKQI